MPGGLDAGAIPAAPAPEATDPFPPGEAAARERSAPLAGGGIERYPERHDRAGGRDVRALALPALRLRLGARDGGARPRQGRPGADAFVRQLAWRDFYAHVLLHHPGNARHAYKPQFDELDWADDGEALAAWCEGRTGFPVVDAGMRQLLASAAGCTTARG